MAKLARELLRGRRTVALFEPGQLDESVLTRAIDNARFAPNHKKTEPWRCYALGPASRANVLALADTVLTEKHGSEKAAKKLRRWHDVPGWFVVTAARNPDDPFREKEDYAACCCFTHSLLLSLFSEGYGSKWSSFGSGSEANEFAKIVGFDVKEQQFVSTVWWGKPLEKRGWPSPPRKRFSAEDVLIRRG